MKFSSPPSDGTFSWVKDAREPNRHHYRLYGNNGVVYVLDKKDNIRMCLSTSEAALMGMTLLIEWPIRRGLGLIWEKALNFKVEEIAEEQLKRLREVAKRSSDLQTLRGMAKWGTVVAPRPNKDST